MKILTLATISVAMLASAPDAAPLDRFSSYIAFGDSLTDDGKFGVQAPPSLGGRFSNGITYAEHLALEFASKGRVAVNLAIGGATAEDDNETPLPLAAQPFSTFSNQIATLDQQLKFTALGAAIGNTPLVSVLFGANDLLQDLTEGTFIGEIGQNAADAVTAGIQSVATLRPEFNNFLLINLPNLARTPAFAGGAGEALAGAESQAFNARLAANAMALRASGLNIVEFDLDGYFQAILGGSLGIPNVTDQCIASFQAFDPFNNCAVAPDGTIEIALADDFLFVDSIHPNRIAQAAFADEIRTALAPVPLPAGLPLLLVGIFGLALLRRRV